MNNKLNEWYDSTSYSLDDKERKPTRWTFDTGKLQITVVSKHRFNPDCWVMHCHQLGIDTRRLNYPPETLAEDIQGLSIRIARQTLNAMLNSLPTETP